MVLRGVLASVCCALICVINAQTIRADGPTVYINESPAFTLMATLDGLVPAVRAARIVETVRKGKLTSPLDMRATARGIWLQCGNMNVVRVTPQEAAKQGIEQRQLAIQWKNRIESALALPAVQAANNLLLVSTGQVSLVRLVGFEATQAEFECVVPGIVETARVAGGLQITPKAVGETEVIIRTPKGRTRVIIKVQRSAVTETPRITAELFASSGTPTAVEAAVTHAIRQQLKTVELATIEILALEKTSVPMGSTQNVKVRVRVQAQDALPFEGDLLVKVSNASPGRVREEELWYSNHPESVRANGPLFSSQLTAGKPVRLLYHHVNESSEAMTINVVVYNSSTLPAQIQTIRGDGAPDGDPVRTGMEAGELFLRAWLKPGTEILTVPPRSALPIAVRLLPKRFTMSGLCYLSLLPGGAGKVLIRTESLRPNSVDSSWQSAGDREAPWIGAVPRLFESLPTDLAPSRHVYESPFREIDITFRVGGKHAFVRIGQSPIGNADDTLRLQGNFGVLYTVSATLENPTRSARRVEIAFEASAGYSGGLFVVDGEVHRTEITQSKAERTLKVVRLAPSEKRRIRIVTMPLSGSSYPATLVFRPAGLGSPPVAQLSQTPN